MVELRFDGVVFEWRGPAPHHFVAVPPPGESDALRSVAAGVTYGWGMIPVRARIGGRPPVAPGKAPGSE